MSNLITKVEQWSMDKGLHQEDPRIQLLRAFEEFGETFQALGEDESKLKDGIGDSFVTLIILCQQKGVDYRDIWNAGVPLPAAFSFIDVMTKVGELSANLTKDKGDFKELVQWFTDLFAFIAVDNDLDPEDCLAYAYDEIKHRKGKKVGGTFVKEDDLESGCKTCKL